MAGRWVQLSLCGPVAHVATLLGRSDVIPGQALGPDTHQSLAATKL